MQTNFTHFKVGLFCKRLFAIVALFTILTQSVTAQTYCTAGATSTAFEKIGNVTFATINNTSTSTAGYENFSAIVANVFQGIAYPISITVSDPFSSDQAYVWIDYNNNGLFTDGGELVFTSAVGTGPYTGTIAIPIATTPGTKRMRIRLDDTSFGSNASPCGTSTYGQVEDYTLNVQANIPCAGTPAPGNTNTTATTACAGIPFTLSLQTIPAGTGITYQWQSAPTATGPWTNITGATNLSLTTPQTASTFYRCAVTCAASTSTGTSTPIQVLLTPANQCYCASGATSTADEEILNVTVGTLNNTSTCTTLAPGPGSVVSSYANYTSGVGAPAIPNIIQGTNFPFRVSIGTCGGNFANSTVIFIDYNQDGIFTVAERAYATPASTAGPHTLIGTLAIPATALLGTTRMRVINVETASSLTINPCGTYTWGETEDYNVNIVPCIPVTLTAQPANTSVTCGGNTTFSVTATGSIPTYIWQFRTSATAAWQVVAGAPYSGFTTNTLTITNATTTLNGYQYRVQYAGGCTSTDFSSAGTLTINPIVAVVTPVSATLCQGGVQQLSITNIASPAAASVTANSTFTTPLAIPDGSPVGINNTIPVTVPAGAVVTGVSVRVSGTHQWYGDLVMALRAPNGRIINLNYYLGVTGGPGATTVFTNTVISSTGTVSLGTATTPFTGTFRADLAPAAGVGGNGNGGPTGFIPNETTWAPLITPNTAANASGNWTIAMYDGFAPDAGALANWSITVNYVIGAPATGIYTGPAGTIFTDAAATVPYTGTAVNTVFVKPTTPGLNNYSVVVTDAACTSLPLTIPVTMFAPVTASTPLTLANQTVCATRNATFALGGTLAGGPLFNHQFQVRVPGGTAWTNVSNGANYGGATTSTLTVLNTPASFNGYQYRDSISTGGGCGFLISPVATLTVNPAAVVTISAAPVTKLFPGLTTTLTAAVSPNAAATYQWFRDGVAVAGATTNRYIVNIDRLGRYTVAVTDVNSCASAAGASTPASIAITDSVNTARLFIYPSPNTGQFQVRHYTNLGDGSPVPAAVNVYDEKGSLVFNQAYRIGGGYQPMNVTISPSHGRGIYRVDLVDTRGGRIKTGTVIIF